MKRTCRNEFGKRSATPVEIRVKSAHLVEIRAAVGTDQTLDFLLTDDEVADLWTLLHKARVRAMRDVIFQNMSDEEDGVCA